MNMIDKTDREKIYADLGLEESEIQRRLTSEEKTQRSSLHEILILRMLWKQLPLESSSISKRTKR